MSSCLLVTDVQPYYLQFLANERLPERITEAIEQHDYDHTLFVVNYVPPEAGSSHPPIPWELDSLPAPMSKYVTALNTYVKYGRSAFYNEALVTFLRNVNPDYIDVAGAYTEKCVTDTAIDLYQAGFPIRVRADLCATRKGYFYHMDGLHAIARVIGEENILNLSDEDRYGFHILKQSDQIDLSSPRVSLDGNWRLAGWTLPRVIETANYVFSPDEEVLEKGWSLGEFTWSHLHIWEVMTKESEVTKFAVGMKFKEFEEDIGEEDPRCKAEVRFALAKGENAVDNEVLVTAIELAFKVDRVESIFVSMSKEEKIALSDSLVSLGFNERTLASEGSEVSFELSRELWEPKRNLLGCW